MKLFLHTLPAIGCLVLWTTPSWGAMGVGPQGSPQRKAAKPVDLLTQSYAVIDMSGAVTNNQPVYHVALDEASNGAFGYYDGPISTAIGSNTHYIAYTWVNGARSQNPATIAGLVKDKGSSVQDANGENALEEFDVYNLSALRSDGTVYGDKWETLWDLFHNRAGNPPQGYKSPHYAVACSGTSDSAFSFSTSLFKDQGFGLCGAPGYQFNHVQVDSTSFLAVSDDGHIAGQASGDDPVQSTTLVRFAQGGQTQPEGRTWPLMAFYTGDFPDINAYNAGVPWPDVIRDNLDIYFMNNAGMVLGASVSGGWKLYKLASNEASTSTTLFGSYDGTVLGMNNQGDAIDSGDDGGFSRDGVRLKMCEQLSRTIQSQVKNVFPVAISDRNSITHDAYALAWASVIKGAVPGTFEDWVLTVWRIPQDGLANPNDHPNWDCRVVTLPSDVANVGYPVETFPVHFNASSIPLKINSSGVIAAVGSVGASSATSGSYHALLLLPMQLDQVTYGNAEAAPKGNFDVFNDATGNPFKDDHSTNQWQEPNPYGSDKLTQTGWEDPICYSSGSTMLTFVQFKVPAGARAAWSGVTNIKIKGMGVPNPGKPDDSAGYNFTNGGAGFPATFSSVGDAIVSNANGMTCDKAFAASTVGYINPLTIRWYISANGGSTWVAVEKSKNECFITLTAPILKPMTGGIPQADSKYKLFQTVLYYACSHAGATNNNAAVANTWSLFTSGGTGPANICAWNPDDKKYDKKLCYYGKGFQPFQPTSSKELLAATDGDGQCYSFGQLFEDALWANGIDNNGIRITSKPPLYLLLVKVLKPSQTGSFPMYSPFSWKMTFQAKLGYMNPAPDKTTVYGTYGDFVNQKSLRGQNTAPPAEKVFGNHYIVKYLGAYYDPSYGTTYKGEDDFESKAVQGYGALIPGDKFNLAVEPAAGLHNIQFTDFTQPHL